MSQHWS